MDTIRDIAMRFNIFELEDNKILVTEEKQESKLEIGILKSVDEFIKKNPSTKEVTSPIFFQSPGQPDPNGLLSYEIFGLTKEERSGIFGYIDLHADFFHPLIYKKLLSMSRNIRECVHGTKKFIIDSEGQLVEDEKGNTGIKWLKANFSKIKFKQTGSDQRANVLKFIKANEDRLFTDKYLVLPAYYRDVDSSKGGKVAVGEINEIYSSLLIAVKAIKETEDYGLSVADSVKGRIQELILAIYDWLAGNNNDMLEGASGLSKKLGIIRRSGKSKTADYGARLVISAPNLKVEFVDDIMVDIKHCALPLAATCANFLPYMVYHVKRFFENEFAAGSMIVAKKDEQQTEIRIKEPMIQFSDERITEELHRYIHGYSNRFIAVTVEAEDGKKYPLKFKGRRMEGTNSIEPQPGDSSLINRTLTWCDIFYIAACEATRDKTILITRYPMDSAYNQFPSYIRVASTVETEPVFYGTEFYKYYPKIREEDIGTDTSNKFVDTLRMSNLLLSAIGGDYDGDTVSAKGVYSKEANEELSKHIESKANYINLSGKPLRSSSNEAIQSIYDLTRVLPGTKLDEVVF